MSFAPDQIKIDLEARQLCCERDDRILFDQHDVRGGNGDL